MTDLHIPADVQSIFDEADASGDLAAMFTNVRTVRLVNTKSGATTRESQHWLDANEYARRVLNALPQ